MNKLRIGFLSTANIGRKNWKSIRNSGNSIVSAVASRDLAKSRAFVAECQQAHPFEKVPMAMGSYDELMVSPDVDAIYFPLPTGLRKDVVIRAAQHGKHVICEKPCASNVAELEEMIAACRRHAVQFIDGVMFMHGLRLPKIREVLDGQKVGPIRRITSAFSFYSGEDFFRNNIRADGTLEPTGCLGDLGWYSIRFALWALNWQMPESVLGRILSESVNVSGRTSAPSEFTATLFYPGGVTVEFYSSFRTGHQQWVHVSGQNGWLRLPDFVHPFNSYDPAFEVNREIITVPTGAKCPAGADQMEFGHAAAQDTQLWRNFANQIASDCLNEDWPMWSLKTQQVLDACHESARMNSPLKIRR